MKTVIQLPANEVIIEWWYEELYHSTIDHLIDALYDVVKTYSDVIRMIAVSDLLRERLERAPETFSSGQLVTIADVIETRVLRIENDDLKARARQLLAVARDERDARDESQALCLKYHLVSHDMYPYRPATRRA